MKVLLSSLSFLVVSTGTSAEFSTIEATKPVDELEPAILPPPTSSCSCLSDYDCKRSPYCPNKCVFNKYSRTGTCQAKLTRAPTDPPTKSPTEPPTFPPVPNDRCFCQSDYDCFRSSYCPNKCVFTPYSRDGTCQDGSPTPPTKEPTEPPVGGPCCEEPRPIPTECEVQLLIELMEVAVNVNLAIAPQWLRLSFHDAGTFDQNTFEGGANGCLLTHFPMRQEPENTNLDIALNTLQAIKNAWENHADTCLEVSAADMIQFAGWFSVFRQMGSPGLTGGKINDLINRFQWGRPDEQNCDTSWTHNLPGFRLGTNSNDIPARCMFAGGEIKNKMMDRNGFTAEEATAMMGAHSIGQTRSVFGSGLAAPWVESGDDFATSSGPVLNNDFHSFLVNDIVENTAPAFATNIQTFNQDFGDWFRDSQRDLNHLDTDVALAFPSLDLSIHPHFHLFTQVFANDNNQFLTVFLFALEKMSSFGVTVPLIHVLPCEEGCLSEGSVTLDEFKRLEVETSIDKGLIEAEDTIEETNEAREAEILELTTEVNGFNI